MIRGHGSGRYKYEPPMKVRIVNLLIVAVVALVVVLAVSIWVHGTYCDFVRDEMHGEECWRCNVYKWGNMNDAAFAVREMRRKGAEK